MNISSTKFISMTVCGNHIQGVNTFINGNPTEHISDIKYLGYLTSDCKSESDEKLQIYSKLHGIMWRQMTKEIELRIHNITAKVALKFYSEAWLLRKGHEQNLEASPMKFLIHPLGIFKLDWERKQSIRDKLGVQNTVQEIHWYQQKWLQHLKRMERTGYPNRHYSIN